jgi:serine/threonine-protein kinase
MPSPDPLALPDVGQGPGRLGPYQLVRPISAGGMARVYEGVYESFGGVQKAVAIKIIHPEYAADPQFRELFIAEARVSALLNYHGLVHIYGFECEGDLLYLVMEYIEGLTFRKILGLSKRFARTLPVDVIAELGRQVCDALHYAHMAVDRDRRPLGLVHRDIKPSNLMLDVHGFAKVLDFGISYATTHQEQEGQVKGTWGYMALEQAEGQVVGPPADVFGVAAVLYELAALEPLFADKDNDAVRRRLRADHAAQRAADLGGAYAELGAVLVRALQRDPAARFPTAASFGTALERLVPDPVTTRQRIARLIRELQADEAHADVGAGVPPPAARRPQPNTSSTVSPRLDRPPPPARGASASRTLPVKAGDANGVGPRVQSQRPVEGRSGPPGLAAFLLVVAIAILAFAAWALVAAPLPDTAPADASRSPQRPDAVYSAPPTQPAVASPPAVAPSDPVDAVKPAASGGVPPGPTAPASDRTPDVSAAPPARSTTQDAARAQAVARVQASAAETPDADAPVRIPPSRASAQPAASSPTARVTGEGRLTIGADVRSQVIVDGRYIRNTPLFEEVVSAGVHEVVLVTDDGRRKSVRVDVPAGGTVTRVWSFAKETWEE